MDDSPLNFDRGADLPVFVPIESFPNLSDAEIEAITRSGDPRLRNAEDVCKAGDLAHASASIEEILHGVMSPKDMGNCPMYATKSENEDLVRMLVTSGVHSYVGIAKMAIELRSAAILALLLGHGWEINQDGAWCVPLVLSTAVYVLDDSSLIAWFLEHGADPNKRCGIDETPLSTAVAHAPIHIIKQLFAACPPDTKFCGQILHWAAGRGTPDSEEVVQLVLDKCQPEVNDIMYLKDGFSYEVRKVVGLGTALHDVAWTGLPGVARLLLRNGAEISIRDSRGNNALQAAEREGNFEVAKSCARQKPLPHA